MSFKNFNYTGKYKIFSVDTGNILEVCRFTSKAMLNDIIIEREKQTQVTWRRYYIDIYVDERLTDDDFELK